MKLFTTDKKHTINSFKGTKIVGVELNKTYREKKKSLDWKENKILPLGLLPSVFLPCTIVTDSAESYSLGSPISTPISHSAKMGRKGTQELRTLVLEEDLRVLTPSASLGPSSGWDTSWAGCTRRVHVSTATQLCELWLADKLERVDQGICKEISAERPLILKATACIETTLETTSARGSRKMVTTKSLGNWVFKTITRTRGCPLNS